ncbi:hypothetical protein [Algoriphagus boritolerans]|uniref:hypothetical protein n=1 Tax=Algoriphagus boritolerans TaxID=308111 RepID=UPI000A40BA29
MKTGLILTGVFALAILFRGTPGYFIFLFIGGWISWTFVEYAVHRFILHELIVPGKKESLFHHQEHHINPQDIKVGFLHRIITLVLAIGIFWLALKLNNTFTIFAGFFTGFLFLQFSSLSTASALLQIHFTKNPKGSHPSPHALSQQGVQFQHYPLGLAI